MTKVTLDFETRSEVDLRKSNPYIYAQHPSTEILCLAYKIDSDEIDLIRFEDIKKFNEILFSLAENPSIIFEAHNANFERCIWYWIMHKRYGFPNIPLERWYCSAAKAAYHNIPRSLDGAAQAIGLNTTKDMKGHRLMLKMCKPRKPTKHNKAKWHETPEDLERLYQYCIQDVETEYQISKALPELPEFERQIWLLDQKINDRGIHVDVENIDKIIKLLEKVKIQTKKEISILTGNAITSPNQVAKLKKYIGDLGLGLPDLSKETVEEALKRTATPRKAIRLLGLRQDGSLSSTKKFKTMKALVNKENRVNGSFLYGAANTQRWGGKGVQFHNLPRSSFDDLEDTEFAFECINEPSDIQTYYGSIAEFSKKMIRPMVLAPKGKTLVCADYSSIEARVLLWLANDEQGLEEYRFGKCAYCMMASKIYNIPYETIKDGYDYGDKESIDQRFVGKQAVLGLGYGMGAQRFYDQCKQYGHEIPYSMAERTVKVYRNVRVVVKRYWNTVENAAKITITTSRLQKVGKVFYQKEGRDLYCNLPSGRSICYKDAYVDENDTIRYMSILKPSNKWGKASTWGGKLVENIDQGISRDLLATAMLKAESKNCGITLHVHDEIMAEDTDLDTLINIMCDLPKWAKGLPIKAEGWKGERYKK